MSTALFDEVKTLSGQPIEDAIREHALQRQKAATRHAVAIGEPLFLFIETTWPTKPDRPQNAVITVRISDADDEETAGIDRQIEDSLTWARMHMWGVGTIVIENDVSAYKRKKTELPDGRVELRTVRPKYRAMIARLYSKRNDGLIAYDLDRLVRDMRDLEDLIDVVEMHTPMLGVASITGSLRMENDSDIAMARILTALNNKASRDTARRVSRAYVQRIVEGGFGGGMRSYGFGMPLFEDPRNGKMIYNYLAVVPGEADEIKKWAKLVIGGMSLNALMNDLNERKVPSVRGGKWGTRTIKAILTAPRVAGLRDYKGEILVDADVPWEPIITREQWEVLRSMFSASGRKTSPGNKPKWLLSGLAKCGHPSCEGSGHLMRVGGLKKNNAVEGGGYRAYRCHAKGHCWMRADTLEAAIVELVVERLAAPDASDLSAPEPATDTAVLAEEANIIRGKMAEFLNFWKLGILGEAEFITGRKELSDRLEGVEAELANSTSLDPMAGAVGLDEVRERWEALSLGQRRAVITRLMDITILKSVQNGGRIPGGGYFDARRLKIEWKGGK